MKINRTLLVISIFLISLLAVGAVSASDNDGAADITAASDVMVDIDNDDADEVISSSDDNEMEITGTDLQNEDETLGEEDTGSEIEMNVSANDTAYDKDAVIEISVKNKTAPADFNNTVVNVYVDGTFFKNVTLDKDGKVSLNIAAGTYDVGSYHIQAYLDNNVEITKDAILNIIKATPIVNVDNVTSKAGEIITIPFNVTDSRGKGISGDVIITIFWEQDSISKYVRITDGSAKASFNISELIGIFGNGTFNISSLFNGTNGTFDIASLFNGTNGTFNMSTLFGENSTFDISSFLNGTSNITVGNSTFDLSGLMNGTFSIGNSSFNISSLLNGTTKISFGNTTIDFSSLFGGKDDTSSSDDVLGAGVNDKLNSETPDFTSLFSGNSTFKIGNSTFDLSSLLNGTFTIGNSSFDIAGLLNGTTNMSMGNKTFDFGSLFNGTNSSFDISGLLDMLLGRGNNTFAYLFTPGTYKISVTYLSSRNYNEFTNDAASLIVTPSNVTFPLTTDLTCSGVTAVAGVSGKYLTLTLKDVLGDAVSNKTVKIGFNGKEYNVITDNDGNAKLQINMAKAGVYTASVCFLGDNVYTGSFKVVKVTVNKQAPKLSVAKKTYKAKSKKKILKATFKSAKGKAIKGKKITFKVKGKTYSAKTNKKGVASVKVKITKKGKYTFTAKFAGDSTYKAVSKKAKLIIK